MARPTVDWPSGETLARLWSLPLVEVHGSVPSTQDRAFELAKAGASPWTAVVARSQSEGRGRRGSAWESADGLGLWVSLILPEEDPGGIPVTLRLGLLLSEAVEQALANVTAPKLRVEVKWPNDVWIGGRKLGGVLTERSGRDTVAGIGINVWHQPHDFGDGIKQRATSLALEGWTGDAVRFGGKAIAHIQHGWIDSPDDALTRLRARDALIGRALMTPDGRVGHGAGIAEDGALRVGGEGEEWRVVSGTVQLLDHVGTTDTSARDG